MPEPAPFRNEQASMIGIGEYRVGSFPMITIGLGSCIGLTLYDPNLRLGAMVHIMLPGKAGEGQIGRGNTQILLSLSWSGSLLPSAAKTGPSWQRLRAVPACLSISVPVSTSVTGMLKKSGFS